MMSQLSSSVFNVVFFFCQIYLLFQVSCQYHHWSCSYDNFLLEGIDQKSGNWNYPVWILPNILTLGWVIPNLARMPLIKSYWMPGLNLLPFLSHEEKSNRDGGWGGGGGEELPLHTRKWSRITIYLQWSIRNEKYFHASCKLKCQHFLSFCI